MKSTNHNKIREELVDFFNEERTFELQKRLKDLHLLQSLAIKKTKLSSDNFHIRY